MNYTIAVDLGASSGRVMLSSYDGVSLKMEEVYRFVNGPFERDGRYYWDIEYIIDEIKKGLKKAATRGYTFSSIGFDTWGVDFGCLDKSGRIMGNPVSYRDEATIGIMEEIHAHISIDKMYGITGIQPSYYNTLYRLYNHKNDMDKILMLPSLLSYYFSGVIKNEYTIASTSQLIDLNSQSFSGEIFNILSVDKNKMADLVKPGQILGEIDEIIADECGLNNDLQVIAVPGHDTACAVSVKPNAQNCAYVVLGTWTIVGVELDEALRDKHTLKQGFTNEAGVFNSTRFLKNITGLWVMNQVKIIYERTNGSISFDEITSRAQEYDGQLYNVNIQDQRFNNPDNMYDEVELYLKDKYNLSEINFGLMAYAIFNGMAELIADTIRVIEGFEIKIDNIGVLGGGSKNKFLLELIKKKTFKHVIAGPVEASALGNTLMQYYGLGHLKSLEDIRSLAERYSTAND